jgi:hypothetical protein
MSFSMSQASLPVFEIGLNALSVVLDKAEAHAAAKKIDSSVLLNSRLSPDMFALARQVQIATDQAKNGSARGSKKRYKPRCGQSRYSWKVASVRIPPSRCSRR